jgi:hypothetical protein
VAITELKSVTGLLKIIHFLYNFYEYFLSAREYTFFPEIPEIPDPPF